MSCEVVFPKPSRDANKYSRGKLVVLAGSARYPGAAVLSARAAQRMGAGYTEVVTDPRAVDVVRLASPSLVVRDVTKWSCDELPAPRADRPCTVCLGPGFVGRGSRERSLVDDVLRRAACPVLVDGGALGLLCGDDLAGVLAARREGGFATVLTPHAGEAARLASARDVGKGDPAELADALAKAYECVVILKGPDTFIADGGQVVAMREGTPALAKAGTGDVLAGMVAALLAQGLDAMSAACTGATAHARAGSRAAEEYTEIGVVAEDVIDFIPAVLREGR